MASLWPNLIKKREFQSIGGRPETQTSQPLLGGGSTRVLDARPGLAMVGRPRDEVLEPTGRGPRAHGRGSSRHLKLSKAQTLGPWRPPLHLLSPVKTYRCGSDP
ncbi:hypothetical protein CDL15_Pgr019438 [Punica granatum]|uniref:Uncharacterized protein n=1 Tax=Punica granatum TaxID=22663 RepID=A0A218XSE2_PUNGR|nr:hypothetical protein CDL15_Pgr019438 [Punica granatum]PKI61645.1 hypothetical protein CRG98_017957 [Punica granatum]